MTSLSFTVIGTPIPQGSMQSFRRGNKTVYVPANKNLKAWREAVRAKAYNTATAEGIDLPLGANKTPLMLSCTFVFPRPKSVPKTRPMSVKPDLDKLVRAVCDALGNKGAGQIIEEDSRINVIAAKKRYADGEKPHVKITIKETTHE